MYNRGGSDIKGPQRGYPEAMRPLDDPYNNREGPPLSWREKHARVTHDIPAPQPLLDEGYNVHEQAPLHWRARQSGGPQNAPLGNPIKPFNDEGEQLSWRARQLGSGLNQNSLGTKPLLDDHRGRQNAPTRNTPVDHYGEEEKQLSWRGRRSGSTSKSLDSAQSLFDKHHDNGNEQLSWRAREVASQQPPRGRSLMDDASANEDPGNLSWRLNERTHPNSLPSIRTMEEILANVKKGERGFEKDRHNILNNGDPPRVENLSWRTANVDRRRDDNRYRMDPYSRPPVMAKDGIPSKPLIENGRKFDDAPANLSWRGTDMPRNGNGSITNQHQYDNRDNHMEPRRHPDTNMPDHHLMDGNDRLSWRQMGAGNNSPRNPIQSNQESSQHLQDTPSLSWRSKQVNASKTNAVQPSFPNQDVNNHHADSDVAGLSWRSRDQGIDRHHRPHGYPP